MNGKRAKQIRRAQGFTIDERRARHEFERKIATTLEQRAANTVNASNTRRAVLAWVALIAIAAAILAGLFL